MTESTTGHPLTEDEIAALTAQRDERRARLLHDDRPESSARGVHHVALFCADVERTTAFYQDLLEFPLTDMF